MQLKEINKQKYDKHFKQLFIAIVIMMLAIALASSTLLIQLIGSPEEGSNFWLNVIGVIVAAFCVGSLLRKYKTHPYMYEVMYVWDLKQNLNQIQRKKTKLLEAANKGNKDAMCALLFLYRGSEQLFTLDNNTITMEELHAELKQLEQLIEQYQFDITIEDYKPALLDQF